jgi:isoleucyl-tRNA synthetase
LAIAVNPKFVYVRVQVGNEIYVISKERLSSLAEILA